MLLRYCCGINLETLKNVFVFLILIQWTLWYVKRDGDISWTMTSRGHYFSKWVTSRGHFQRVTFRGHFW